MKISLAQQIEEVDDELKQRERVYAGIARKNPGRRAELDYRIERMRAVRRTLQWVAANEAVIREAAGQHT